MEFKSWKMSFNSDPMKIAEEVIFLRKKQKQNHIPLCFHKSIFKQVTSTKNFWMLIDTKENTAWKFCRKVQFSQSF